MKIADLVIGQDYAYRTRPRDSPRRVRYLGKREGRGANAGEVLVHPWNDEGTGPADRGLVNPYTQYGSGYHRRQVEGYVDVSKGLSYRSTLREGYCRSRDLSPWEQTVSEDARKKALATVEASIKKAGQDWAQRCAVAADEILCPLLGLEPKVRRGYFGTTVISMNSREGLRLALLAQAAIDAGLQVPGLTQLEGYDEMVAQMSELADMRVLYTWLPAQPSSR